MDVKEIIQLSNGDYYSQAIDNAAFQAASGTFAAVSIPIATRRNSQILIKRLDLWIRGVVTASGLNDYATKAAIVITSLQSYSSKNAGADTVPVYRKNVNQGLTDYPGIVVQSDANGDVIVNVITAQSDYGVVFAPADVSTVSVSMVWSLVNNELITNADEISKKWSE